MKKAHLLKFILVVLFFGFTSCESVQGGKTIKLAHGLEENHPVHKAMAFVGEELEKNRKAP